MPGKYFRILLCSILLPVSGIEISAQSALLEKLDSSVLTEKLNESHIRVSPDMGFSVDMELLTGLPKLLGSSDPLRYIQYLPGVQMNAEHDSGIRINGCDHSHNNISLDGIPVYGATHLFGLFSIFNPFHFDGLTMRSGNREANRIGGSVEMHPRLSVPDKAGASFSAGLMETEGTLELPVGDRSAVYVSARRSYVNLLYGSFLEIDGVPLKYSMTDFNLTATSRVSDRDQIWADFYWGRDAASSGVVNLGIDLDLDWGNLLGGLHWKHDWKNVSLTNSISFSGFDNAVEVRQVDTRMTAPSFIRDFSYNSEASSGKWKWGLSAVWHEVRPQNPDFSSSYMSYMTSDRQSGLEADAYASRDWSWGDSWSAGTFLKAGYYLSPERESYFGIYPSADVSCNLHRGGVITLKGEIQRQNVFQTGLSNIGLPVEFWMMAGELAGPQTSMGGSLCYKLNFGKGGFALSTEVYYKKLSNQVEFTGNLFDLLGGNYDIRKSIVLGRGENYGATFMLHKKSGALTGWISYALGRALRFFDDDRIHGWVPSSHERPHEVNAVATYRLGSWDFGGMFVFASGTPFTASESFYVNGGRLMVKYADFNAARLPSYARLDLSVNYYFNRRPDRENGINFSLYNVLGRKNAIFYRLNLFHDGEERYYAYKPISMNLRFLPSVSYFHKF